MLASTASATPACSVAAHSPHRAGTLRVTEVLAGNATTDFGAPGAVADADHRALRSGDRERLATILVACWSSFDAVASRRPTLRTGPRGGGRDVDKMRRHVTDADAAYARKLGLRVSATDGDPDAIDALRERVLGVLRGEVAPEREPALADPLRRPPHRVARVRPPLRDRGPRDRRLTSCDVHRSATLDAHHTSSEEPTVRVDARSPGSSVCGRRVGLHHVKGW